MGDKAERQGGGAVADGLFDEDGPADALADPPGRFARALAWLGGCLAAERPRWVLWVPVGVGLGVALYFALPVEPPGWAGAAAAGACLALVRPVWRWSGAVLALLALLSVAVGFSAAQLRTALVEAPMLQREIGPVTVTGRVLVVERLEEGTRLVLADLRVERLAPAATPARARVRLTAGSAAPAPGAEVTLRAVLHPPPGPAEPGAYDFQRHAFFRGLGAVGFAVGPARVVDAPPVTGWRAVTVALELARERIAARVAAVIADPGDASVTAALLNGEQVGIPESVMQAMRDSGLAHLLSISGLHIGLVAGIVFFTVRALLALVEPVALRWPIKKIAAVFGIVAALAYTLLVGAPLPTVRSVLMTGMVLAAVLVDRDPLSMRLVAFAALVTILMEPDGMLGPSFQMSFAAVIALIAAYEALGPVLVRWKQGTGPIGHAALYLGGVALTSVIATAATTPFSLYHFQQIAFYGVLSNMVAVPVTSFWVMPCSLIAYALMPFGLEAPALAAMGWGVRVIIETARLTAGLPGAVALIPAMSTAALVAMVFGGLWLAVWTGRWRLWGLAAMLGGLLTPAFTHRPDVLVSDDAKLMAVRMADGRLSLSSRSDGRVAETWLRRDGRDEPGPPWPRTGASADGRLTCDALGCLYRARGRTVALLRLPDALAEDCDSADAVVGGESARRCRAPVVIDRWRLRRDGPHMLTLSATGLRVESVGDTRGDRPWVVR